MMHREHGSISQDPPSHSAAHTINSPDFHPLFLQIPLSSSSCLRNPPISRTKSNGGDEAARCIDVGRSGGTRRRSEGHGSRGPRLEPDVRRHIPLRPNILRFRSRHCRGVSSLSFLHTPSYASTARTQPRFSFNFN